MSHQVYFYLTPADSLKLAAEIDGLEPAVFLERMSASDSTQVESMSRLDGRHGIYHCISRSADTDLVLMRHIPNQGKWVIDELRSAVIEFDCCFSDAAIIRRGRFYYVEKYFDEQDQEVRKPEAFRRWAKNVLAKAKKHLTKVGSDYGAEAKQLLDSGEVTFEPL